MLDGPCHDPDCAAPAGGPRRRGAARTMSRSHGASLARHVAAGYALLIVYASLHPFTGWHDSGAPLTEFLTAAWPRYYTGFDVFINVLAYVPLGLHLVPALRPRLPPGWAVLLALALGCSLSFGLEVLQNFLPSRVPSNVDLGCNALGTALGAVLGHRFGALFEDRGGVTRWRVRRFVGGRRGDLGLLLLALWLITQLDPEILLFGPGDLRGLLGVPAPLLFTAERILAMEAAVACLGMIAVGLVAWRTMRLPSAWLLGTLFVLALGVRALSAGLVEGPGDLWRWATPGNAAGLALAALALPLLLRLSARSQQALAALALLTLTALVNLAPENPYVADLLQNWRPGHLLNFFGLTRLASAFWPFLALAYLMLVLPAERKD
jgi:VanZ family protein